MLVGAKDMERKCGLKPQNGANPTWLWVRSHTDSKQ